MLICGSVCDYPRHPTTKAASLAQWSEIHQWCNSPAVPTEHQSHRLNHPSPTTILLVQPQCSTFGVVCLGSSPQWSDTICTPWNNELHQHRHGKESVFIHNITTLLLPPPQLLLLLLLLLLILLLLLLPLLLLLLILLLLLLLLLLLPLLLLLYDYYHFYS